MGQLGPAEVRRAEDLPQVPLPLRFVLELVLGEIRAAVGEVVDEDDEVRPEVADQIREYVAELAYRNEYVAIRGQSEFAEEAWRRNKCTETPPPPPAPPAKGAKGDKPAKSAPKPARPVARAAAPAAPVSTLPKDGSTY